MKTSWKVFCGMCFAVMMTGVQAATVNLSPISSSVPQGSGTVGFSLLGDFGGTVATPFSLVGGNMDFTWDPSVLTLNSFVFTLAGRDSSYDVQNLVSAGKLQIGFANFSGIPFVGSTTIATLLFNVVGTSGSSTSIVLQDTPNSGFYDANTLAQISVSYSNTPVNITAAIPLPAAFWLLVSGLSPLGFVFRRKAC